MNRTWAIGIAVWLASSGCDAPGRDLPPGYRGLHVPEARLGSGQARQEGRSLFLRHCALCHGEAADGRGERRAAIHPPATDFTSPSWRRGADPRRLFATIREGVRGTSMPGWRHLDDDQIWSLVGYLLAISEEGA